MNISGKTRIYAKDFNGKKLYSTGINRKEEDGTYKNMYVSVQFRQGIEIEDKTTINVTNGFLSFYEDKNGMPKIKLVVLEFESEYSNQEEETIANDMLPF